MYLSKDNKKLVDKDKQEQLIDQIVWKSTTPIKASDIKEHL